MNINPCVLHCRSEVLSERGAQDRGPVVEINVIQRVQIALFPTKCAFCGDEAKEGKKLQRCGTCKAVGYCDRLERSKQITRQSNTAHPRQSLFLSKLAASGGTQTYHTLHSRQNTLPAELPRQLS